jgi:hypothetical protein
MGLTGVSVKLLMELRQLLSWDRTEVWSRGGGGVSIKS